MAFGLTVLSVVTLVFLFIARIRLPASDSLIDVLRKRYGRDVLMNLEHLRK